MPHTGSWGDQGDGTYRNPILNGLTLELTGIVSTNPAQLTVFEYEVGEGGFGTFTNSPNAIFTLYTATNMLLPVEAWSNLGPVTESPPGSGEYQFFVPDNPNEDIRFYSIRSP